MRSTANTYVRLLENINLNKNDVFISKELNMALQSFLKMNAMFAQWLECGVTIKNMNTLKWNYYKIDSLASSLIKRKRINYADLIFVVGEKYNTKQIVSVLQEFYDTHGILLKAKAIDIKLFYKTYLIVREGKWYYHLASVK